jgi:aspartate carbamoyltransferase catalytic subunit
VQTERQHEASISANDYIHGYQLNAKRLKRAKQDALVLHPGPMNRGIEITPEVADGPQSCVLEQVTNGVAVRMAILYLLIAGEVEGGAVHPATQAAPGTPVTHNRRATDRSTEQPISKGKDS